MSEPALVDIVLPSGEQATVPQADLAQALAAGAHHAPAAPTHQAIDTGLGTVQGSALTDYVGEQSLGILARGAGAARGLTFGVSDTILAEGAEAVGGKALRKETLGALSLAKKSNPYSDMAGEALGLYLGPTGAVGELAEGGIAARAGHGLLGKTLAFGGRGAVEGAMIGAQNQITEDTLEDHALIGEQIFASAAKDGLLGLGAGAALGAGSHYLGMVPQLFKSARGPVSDTMLDEIAGGPGMGRLVRDEARSTEGLIGDLQRGGATSEQAGKLAGEANAMGRAHASVKEAEVAAGVSGFGLSGEARGPITGPLDDAMSMYASNRAGGNAQIEEALGRGYAERSARLSQQAKILDEHALKLKAVTDRVLVAERAMDEAQFLQRPDRMAKLIDTSRGELQRDLAASMNQSVENTLGILEATATRGGSPVAVNKIRKQLADVSKLGITMARDEAGQMVSLKPKQLHEIYMGANRLKQTVGREAGFGIAPHMRTEAQREFGSLYETLRVGLEDEAVWGAEAGSNQRVLNEVFSTDFKRSNDFLNRFSVGLDEAKGVPLPEANAESLKNNLLKKLGSEADSQQAIKSTETWIDRNRKRIAALEKHGDLTPEQAKMVSDGRAALADFEKTLGGARKESETLAKLKEMHEDEAGKGLGGVLGLLSDVVTRPATTMGRLAQVRQTTRSLEKAIEGGLGKFFGSKGGEYGAVAKSAAPRAKADVAKEIGDIREIAGNPMALQDSLARFTGDLGKHAPKIAEEVKATATRAIYYLAKEAPQPSVNVGLLGYHNAVARYSDQQLADWEAKRTAAMGAVNGTTAPEAIIADMKKGKLNRDAIEAIEFVSPNLFAKLQERTRAELERMEASGKLAKMPYQQKASIASLLKVPADTTWTSEFIRQMQAAKTAPPIEPTPGPSRKPSGSGRPMKLNADVFTTDAQQIEGRPL